MPKKEKPSPRLQWICGLVSGAAQAGIFNPWDRALYLSVKENRPFLRLANWQSPYRGFSQTVVQRTVSAGLYFPLEDMLIEFFAGAWKGQPQLSAFCAGTLAGSATAVALNPATAVKFQTWGSEPRQSFTKIAAHMFREGGVQPFLKGMGSTIARDAVFGSVFSGLRHIGDGTPREQALLPRFAVDFLAAALATTLSSPLNFIRNLEYATAPDRPPLKAQTVIRGLLAEARACDSTWAGARLLQRRLLLGWGTTRVAVGMATGAQLYGLCVASLCGGGGQDCNKR